MPREMTAADARSLLASYGLKPGDSVPAPMRSKPAARRDVIRALEVCAAVPPKPTKPAKPATEA